MKKIGFLGAFDKTDMILYVGKIISALGKKVLIFDATLTQKARYVVPVINPTLSYVTDFEGLDIAVGFPNIEYLKGYLGKTPEQELEYDVVLVDSDNFRSFESFKLKESNENFFVTSFDLYSLKKGLEILCEMKEVTNLTKVMFSKEVFKEDEDYLNFLATGYKIIWNEYKIYFPLENGDGTIIAENQRLAKIKLKRLSSFYTEGLVMVAQEIMKEVSESQIRQALKIVDKGA